MCVCACVRACVSACWLLVSSWTFSEISDMFSNQNLFTGGRGQCIRSTNGHDEQQRGRVNGGTTSHADGSAIRMYLVHLITDTSLYVIQPTFPCTHSTDDPMPSAQCSWYFPQLYLFQSFHQVMEVSLFKFRIFSQFLNSLQRFLSFLPFLGFL